MSKCTSSCNINTTNNKNTVELMMNQDKRIVTYSLKRQSNPLLDNQVLKNNDYSSCFNFCHSRNHHKAKSKMEPISSITKHNFRQINPSSQTSSPTYRRTQSNSIFELCTCLSTSSISSTSSST